MDKIVIKACLNGIRGREASPGVPFTPKEVAAEAKRCADAGASMVHFHARGANGEISYDPDWYAETDRLIRESTSLVLNHTTVRTADVPIERVLDTLRDTPEPVDMISLNPGYLVLHPKTRSETRETLAIPNDYSDLIALIEVCRERGIVPEPTVLDTGFLSTVALLVHEGWLEPPPYLLLEFSGRFGDGLQVIPGDMRSYTFMTECVGEVFPQATWIAHGIEDSVFEIAELAVNDGAHVRVGFEDRATLADGTRADSNAQFVQWAVDYASECGREPATPEEAREILLVP